MKSLASVKIRLASKAGNLSLTFTLLIHRWQHFHSSAIIHYKTISQQYNALSNSIPRRWWSILNVNRHRDHYSSIPKLPPITHYHSTRLKIYRSPRKQLFLCAGRTSHANSLDCSQDFRASVSWYRKRQRGASLDSSSGLLLFPPPLRKNACCTLALELYTRCWKASCCSTCRLYIRDERLELLQGRLRNRYVHRRVYVEVCSSQSWWHSRTGKFEMWEFVGCLRFG